MVKIILETASKIINFSVKTITKALSTKSKMLKRRLIVEYKQLQLNHSPMSINYYAIYIKK